MKYRSQPALARRPVRPLFLSMVVAAVAMILLALPAFAAMDQAKPGDVANAHAQAGGPAEDATDAAKWAAQNRTVFERDIQLDEFRLMAIQHNDQVKIMDSWARQTLRAIRHRESLDGKNALYVVLDMAIRPDVWLDQNIIYIQSVPIREELGVFAADKKEAERIRQTALVSPHFLSQQKVADRLNELALNTSQMKAVNQVAAAMQAFRTIGDTLAILQPTPDMRGSHWVNPADVIHEARGAVNTPAGAMQTPSLPAYTSDQKLKMSLAFSKLIAGWQDNDVTLANKGISEFVALVQTIDPEAYPSSLRRNVELWYNRAFSGTLVAFIYATAMVLFFFAALGITKRPYNLALGLFTFALICHFAAMAVRWWLNGRIPIQNQFESVMGSAALGCLLGYLLETRLLGKFLAFFFIPVVTAVLWFSGMYYYFPIKSMALTLAAVGGIGLPLLELWIQIRFRYAQAIDTALTKISPGIFGAVFSCVGFVAATALLASPYVFGTNLGADPAPVAGILTNTFWLYIHVNIVIWSYALIFASATVSAIYLGLRQWHWINPIEPGFDEPTGGTGGGGKGPKTALAPAEVSTQAIAQINASRAAMLDTLDQANMVILQMAFWALGVGIMCGAVWADQSWGRPWGWDPKETFALVTWMVYLVIVHVRLVIQHKSDTTAFLSLAGCGIMLFNWIGVNFFLVGLHSYA